MFVGQWFIQNGLMAQAPATVLATINAHPTAPRVFAFGDIAAIMTADSHAGAAFQWAGTSPAWSATLSASIAVGNVRLHLETFQGDESSYRLTAPLNQVARHHRRGWEPESMRGMLAALDIAQRPFKQSRNWAGHTEREREQVVENLRGLANTGYLRSEFRLIEAALPRYSVLPIPFTAWSPFQQAFDPLAPFARLHAIAYSALIKASPNPAFDAALRHWFAEANRIDIRIEIHRDVGPAIAAQIGAQANCLHLITAGNAHLPPNARPLQAFIQLPPGKIGIVDPTTH